MKVLSCVRLFVTPWTLAHQAPLFTEFSKQEYWSGLPFPSPMHESALREAQRRLSTEELMLSNCGAGEDSQESLGQQGDQISSS